MITITQGPDRAVQTAVKEKGWNQIWHAEDVATVATTVYERLRKRAQRNFGPNQAHYYRLGVKDALDTLLKEL